MEWVTGVLGELGVGGPDGGDGPGHGAFPDAAAFRIESPSVEGRRVLEAVLQAAEAEGITVNRVSQGSGAMLLRASELRDMAQAGYHAGVEVCLFVGPRERYGTGAHARSARSPPRGRGPPCRRASCGKSPPAWRRPTRSRSGCSRSWAGPPSTSRP